jgi:hypothetical protein
LNIDYSLVGLNARSMPMIARTGERVNFRIGSF